MSAVISFRGDEEVRELLDRMADEADEDLTRSDAVKILVSEAAEARLRPLWLRVGLSDRRAAQIEALRQQGEDEDDVARELFTEALEHRRSDVLDELGATDELRESVERERQDGESLDDVVRRVLREGVETSSAAARARDQARGWSEIVALVLLVGVCAFVLTTPGDVVLPAGGVTLTDIIVAALSVSLFGYLGRVTEANVRRWVGE